ncbi:hypothetical protein [Paenibacillus macerans]|uniref:hypothetical protein n=1 Tax=Paenibacillus macerans TaxID=44252 RepID=UPI003D31EEFD
MSEASKTTDEALSGILQDDLKKLKKIFDRSFDIVFRYLQIGNDLQGLLVFVDGFTNQDLMTPMS